MVFSKPASLLPPRVLFLRLPLPALDDWSPPTAVTAYSNARAASMGIPALEPIDPRIPLAMACAPPSASTRHPSLPP